MTNDVQCPNRLREMETELISRSSQFYILHLETLCGGHCFSLHFTSEKAKAQRGCVISQLEMELGHSKPAESRDSLGLPWEGHIPLSTSSIVLGFITSPAR